MLQRSKEMLRRNIIAAAALALAGCAATAATVRAPDATLVVDCAVNGAAVYVNESFAGRVAQLHSNAARVVSGPLRVEVRADGYFPAYRDLTVAPGQRARLAVELHAVPAGEPAE